LSLKDESEPITDDEWLVRRVPANRFRTHKVPYVSPGAFEPRVKGEAPDEEGISLYRLACLGSIQPILDFIGDPRKQLLTGFVRMRVSEIRGLGLSIVADRDNDLVGHVVIPELSAEAWRDTEHRRPACRQYMMELAELASRPDAILYGPDQPKEDQSC
jgi:hypothetical protein